MTNLTLDELENIAKTILKLRQDVEQLWSKEKAKGLTTTQNVDYRKSLLKLRREAELLRQECEALFLIHFTR